MDLGGLAPDVESEPVMDLGGLAPDPEPVMDLGALAPNDAVMDLGGLAPDDAVVDLGGLAPDAEVELPMDLGALAPDTETEPVMELGSLAPEEPAQDPGALAPDEAMSDVGAPAADESVGLPGDLAPAANQKEDRHVDNGEPVYTRTLAELYVRQGFTDQALDVYRHLLTIEPDSDDLSARISELEGGAPAGPGGAGAESEEAVETLARDLAESGAEEHDVDTPFAWAGDGDVGGGDAEPDGEGVAGYFESLLDWGSREDT